MTESSNVEFTQLLYERPSEHVARIVMNMPQRRNSQGVVMTYELDDAFKRAAQDDAVHVIILSGAGDHFNAGHDLSGTERTMPTLGESRSFWAQYKGPGWEGFFSREHELYLDITERWRNLPKPTIAQVQGSCIAGGNMLAWACDLIVCADDARFRETTVDMAMPGCEFFAHPFELGVRKAKEWLFTADWMSAQEAKEHGMVNHVVPRAELEGFTLELANRIASKNRFTLKLIKEAFNASQDAMGRRNAMNTAFALHQVAHLQNMLVHGFPVDIGGLSPGIQQKLKEARRAILGDAKKQGGDK